MSGLFERLRKFRGNSGLRERMASARKGDARRVGPDQRQRLMEHLRKRRAQARQPGPDHRQKLLEQLKKRRGQARQPRGEDGQKKKLMAELHKMRKEIEGLLKRLGQKKK
jgi:hypothetical protein